jgi:hypothetical protein
MDFSSKQNSLSDTELIDGLERLLRNPEFLDLYLGYDHDGKQFFAGFESGPSLRELLRTVLEHNVNKHNSLSELIPASGEIAIAAPNCLVVS